MAIDFTFPPEIESVRLRVRQFVDGEVRPAEEKLRADRSGDERADRHDLVATIVSLRGKAKEGGLWLPHLPAEWGGKGPGPKPPAAVAAQAAQHWIEPLVLTTPLHT